MTRLAPWAGPILKARRLTVRGTSQSQEVHILRGTDDRSPVMNKILEGTRRLTEGAAIPPKARLSTEEPDWTRVSPSHGTPALLTGVMVNPVGTAP